MFGFTESRENTFRFKHFPALENLNRIKSVIAEFESVCLSEIRTRE